MPSAKKKRWSWSTGERGVNRLRVYENPQRGVIFAEFYERIAGEHRPSDSAFPWATPTETARSSEELAAQLRLMDSDRVR